MATRVVLDSGPLVALIDQRDPLHEWTTEQLKFLEPPFLTCEAVLSESAFLLAGVNAGLPNLFGLVRDDFVRLSFDLHDNFDAVSHLISKYQDVPMSLADACLVRMSELHDRSRVFTLDSDFKLYRRHGRQSIPLIYPAS